MTLIQFYGSLATTASVFVGILTAYLVTRLSNLLSERSRLKQRIESIDTELEVLLKDHDYRIERLSETEERWVREDAENHVDQFIKYDVGSDWSPSPEGLTVEDALDGLVEHQDVSEDDLIMHHAELIERRWDEIIDELQPRGPLEMPQVNMTDASITAANWIIEALWNIYDREQYKAHESKALEARREVQQLKEERTVLEEQFESLNPEQLQDSIKAAVIPISLSVIFPLLIRFLHELGFVIIVSPAVALIEPITVLVVWLIGFFWTLRFVWVRVTGSNTELPDSPLSKRDENEEVDIESSNIETQNAVQSQNN
ncbi:hypothetical protein [Haloferax chudinovii]|uniref:DUF106 domain-containing protein n=1 Tax=Haloferax chudinovii TaxID=1109010 RepID=A0ABD5XN12_9EURY